MVGQASSPSPTPQQGLAQAATDQQQNAPVPQDQAAGSEQDPRAVGTVQQRQQAQMKANDNDPTTPVAATPMEQAQYTQLVNRFVLMISDPRPSPSGHSPCEQAIQMMNNPSVPLPQAIGFATAQQIFILHHGAKVQGHSYEPDVMFHAADECVASMYLLGLARGLFKGMPPYKPQPAGQPYPFEPAEVNVIGHAKLYTVQKFGAMLQQNGEIQLTERKQAVDFWQQQIQREIKSGEVDQSLIEKMQNDGQDKLAQTAQDNGLNSTNQQPDPSGGIAPSQPPQQAGPPPPPPQPQAAPQAPGGQ